MTNATKYYIWLSLALGYSTPKCKALASIYPNISAFYQGGVMEWRLSGVLNDKDIAALEATPLEKAYEVIARCNELGISILSLDDPSYPEKLKEAEKVFVADPHTREEIISHFLDFHNAPYELNYGCR